MNGLVLLFAGTAAGGADNPTIAMAMGTGFALDFFAATAAGADNPTVSKPHGSVVSTACSAISHSNSPFLL